MRTPGFFTETRWLPLELKLLRQTRWSVGRACLTPETPETSLKTPGNQKKKITGAAVA